jgi:hypothetical protein
MPKKFREFERGVRASRRMRTGTPSCFETHRSGLGPWKRLRSGSAATLLSMRARGAALWRNEPNEHFGQTKPSGEHARAKDQPAAVRNDRWRSFIVSGLLFTMRFATHTCRPD